MNSVGNYGNGCTILPMSDPRPKFYAYELHRGKKIVWAFGNTEAEARRAAMPHVHIMVELHVEPVTEELHEMVDALLKARAH